MGEFDEFDHPPDFSEFDAPPKAAGPVMAKHPAAPFIAEPSASATLGEGVKQGAKDLAQPFADIGKGALAASDFAGRAVTHPVDTFGGGKAGAVVREGMRGVNSNIPFANAAVEKLGGPAAESAEDEEKAPGARAFGSAAGIPVGNMVGGIAAKAVESAVPLVGRVLTKLKNGAEERNVSRGMQGIEAGAYKRARLGAKTDVVEQAMRESPDLRDAASIGDDVKLAAATQQMKQSAADTLDQIYTESPHARAGASAEADALRAKAVRARAEAERLKAQVAHGSLFDEARKIDAPPAEEPSLFELARRIDAPLTGEAAKDAGRAAFAEKQAAREAALAEAKRADGAASELERAAEIRSQGATSTPKVPVSGPVANMDKRIARLQAGTSEDRAVARSLESIRDEFKAAHGEDGALNPQRLRSEQSSYQKKSYGKAMPGDTLASASIRANAEASKAVGDSVISHVTGMDYAAAKAAAEADPNGVAARLFKANDAITAANKIDATIADRALRPKAAGGIKGALARIAHRTALPVIVGATHGPLAAMGAAVAQEALHAAPGAIRATARAADRVIPRVAGLGERAAHKVAGALAEDGVATPSNPSSVGSEYRASVRRLAELARRASNIKSFVPAAIKAGFSPADARRIYAAAHPNVTEPETASDEGVDQETARL